MSIDDMEAYRYLAAGFYGMASWLLSSYVKEML